MFAYFLNYLIKVMNWERKGNFKRSNIMFNYNILYVL